MVLYVLFHTTDYNGDGYYQDSILGIYEDCKEAHQVMDELIQKHENTEHACDADLLTSFFIKPMTLISSKMNQ